MGYERNDRRYGGGSGSDRGSDYGSDGARVYGSPEFGRRDERGDRSGERGHYGGNSGRDAGNRNRDYGRDPRGYDYQDRGFFDRAGDEVRSWFGDEDAERRRRADERYDDRGDYRSDNRAGRSDDRRYAEGGRYAPYGSGYTGPSGGYGTADRGGGYSTGDYGAGNGAGATSGFGLGAGNDQRDWGRGPSTHGGYQSWRDRQMAQFDQDYDEYQREHQQKFDNEFHSWRQGRQGQRDLLQKVKEHQEVVGSDGQHIGTVDHVRGDRIKLTKQDKDAGGHHHTIPSSWITAVDDKVTVNKTADQAKAHWRDEEDQSGGQSGGFFGGGQNDRKRNWSFSGS